MTFYDRGEPAPFIRLQVSPGIFEVDFDNFDPVVASDWLHAMKRDLPAAEVQHPLNIWEVDFDTYDPPAPLNPIWGRGMRLREEPVEPALDGLSKTRKIKGTSKPRWTVLEEQTPKLFNAASFLIWSTGKHFNTMITLSADGLGFTDHGEFMKAMPVWHKEMARWMNNGTDRFRRRASKKCQPEPSQPHYWISVVEYARNKGLHVHVLCVLPKGLKSAFIAKTWDWWGKHMKRAPEKSAIDFKSRWPKEQRSQFARHVHLLRYVVKTTADVPILDRHGRQHSLRRVVWAKPKDCAPALVAVPQLTGICRALRADAQKSEGFESDFDLRDFSFLYRNWEYGAWEARMERQRMGCLLQSLMF